MDNLFDLLGNEESDFSVKFRDDDNISLKVNYSEEIENGDYERQYFSVNAVDRDNHQMGLISFNIENKEYVFFGVLLVFKEFARQGVGSKLVEFMEYVAQQGNVSTIRGDYDPEDDRAEKFYNKNGYKIVHIDDYDMVEKCIDVTKHNDNISVSVPEQELSR